MSFGVVLSKFSTYCLSLLKILFVYFWLHCVFSAVSRLFLVGASGGYFSWWWLAFSCSGFFCYTVRALGCGLQLLQLKGLIAPQHVESSQTRDQIPVPCISQWILSHCTTRGSPYLLCVCVCVCVCVCFK